MMFTRVLVWLATTIFLAACAIKPTTTLENSTFSRTGRFAVNLQSTLEKPYAAQGGFSWQDTGNLLLLELSNPMGSIIAQIQITATKSVLRYADGKIKSAASPDDLLALVWGHKIPVSGLRYWLKGLLEPGVPAGAKIFDENHRLISFTQLGWQVKLSKYDQYGPTKIKLLRADSQNRLRLQFVIH